MAGKGKKKRNSKDSTASGGNDGDENAKKKGGGKASKKKSGSAKSTKFQGDIFNEGAMENAYCVCHNVQVKKLNISIEFLKYYKKLCVLTQDVLKVRGFPWPEAAKKKKKGKKK